jgi:hypothetical protein
MFDRQQRFFIHTGTLIFICTTLFIGNSRANVDASMQMRLALREAGHHLLLADHDSESLVLPVIYDKEGWYVVSFSSPLAIVPDSLVLFLNRAMTSLDLPTNYLAEVICLPNREVVYSYQMAAHEEKKVIPCLGRDLPQDMYSIKVFFHPPGNFLMAGLTPVIWVGILSLIASLLYLLFRVKGTTLSNTAASSAAKTLGNCVFYFDERKFVCNEAEIKLTGKESELLQMFYQHPNRILSRDELLKEVWESKGVIVSRSLDTYISLLRKKLNQSNLQISNVHGAGYRLQVAK